MFTSTSQNSGSCLMSEELEARRDGARLQSNSGRGHYQKADALLGDMSIDYKEYPKSFSVNRKVWAKVCSDALRNGLDYAPVIKLVLGEGFAKVRIAIIEWSYLEHLKEIERKYLELTESD
jgi:hypothetical protein